MSSYAQPLSLEVLGEVQVTHFALWCITCTFPRSSLLQPAFLGPKRFPDWPLRWTSAFSLIQPSELRLHFKRTAICVRCRVKMPFWENWRCSLKLLCQFKVSSKSCLEKRLFEGMRGDKEPEIMPKGVLWLNYSAIFLFCRFKKYLEGCTSSICLYSPSQRILFHFRWTKNWIALVTTHYQWVIVLSQEFLISPKWTSITIPQC